MATIYDITFNGVPNTKSCTVTTAGTTIMTASAASLTVDAWIGYTITNERTGVSAVVLDNDATTVTTAEDMEWADTPADTAILSQPSVTPTITKKTVWGNKRIVIGTLQVGNGHNVFPVEGVALAKSQLGLREIEFMSITGGNMLYQYDIVNQLVFGWVVGTATAANILVLAADAVPDEVIHFMAVGYGTR
jgi:hypothetical protein